MRKLIEVALPLDVINVESAREKSIRHGHPGTLHQWWARRPLAACRAVLFAQLVDDPSSHPEEFPTEEAQDSERQRLFEIIEGLVKWENSTNEEVLEAARAEILKSNGGNPPAVHDPFAGGGSIPLEAQRLGLRAYASDLNPVAVLINKALIEIPPRWAGQPPVHPDADQRMSWSGAEGLAEDVRRYGLWVRDEAEKRIGRLYPKAKLDDGSEANVIAWIWARTVTCPNPACGADIPMISTYWLGKKKGKEAWMNPVVQGKEVRFEIGKGPGGPSEPPKIGRGARFRCIVCREVAPEGHIRSEGRARRLGMQLVALAAEGNRQRIYLAASDDQVDSANVPLPQMMPTTALPERALGFRVQAYGMTQHTDIFTSRQLTTLTTLTELVRELRSLIEADAARSGPAFASSDEYAKAVMTYLALAVSRLVNELSALTTWVPLASKEHVKTMIGLQALPMIWDFAEANPFGSSTGSIARSMDSVSRVLDGLNPRAQGVAFSADARNVDVPGAVIATDPPYYDNIGYADLSDLFYVWLRLTLSDVYVDEFKTMLTPKGAELIASPFRHDGSMKAAEKYFEDGFVSVFQHLKHAGEQAPMTLFYAFKQAETDDSEGLGSTGWSTMLEGLLQAGWMVTATWPMRTERQGKLTSKYNILASSVVLACRPRSDEAGITDRQGFVRALHERLPDAMRDLQKASIAPVDLRQAAIGPGMAVFSQFAKVVEPDGGSMKVRTALGLINLVLDQVLDEQQAELDRETRWAIQWFSQFFEDEGPYGTAETLAVSMDVSIKGLKETGLVYSGGGKVRLLSRGELSNDWDPARDVRTPVWEATQYLVKRLEEQGETAAAELLSRLGGVGDSAQTLATILYTKAERARPTLAGPFNALVASWPTIQRLARQAAQPLQSEQLTMTTEE